MLCTFAANTGPEGIAVDSAGNYIVAERDISTLSKVTPGGVRTVIFTFAAETSPWGVAIVPTPAARPVGGVAISVNKLEILAPYLALFSLVGALTVAVAIRRRKP